MLRLLFAAAMSALAGAAAAHDPAPGNRPEIDGQPHAPMRGPGPHAVGTSGDGRPIIHYEPSRPDARSAPGTAAPTDGGSGEVGFGAPARVEGVDEQRPVLGHGPHTTR